MDIQRFFGKEDKDNAEKKSFMFWARCPKCKKAFGIPPKYPVQFLQRAISENQDELDEVLKEINGEGGA